MEVGEEEGKGFYIEVERGFLYETGGVCYKMRRSLV